MVFTQKFEEEVINFVPKISEKRNYWFVRTLGGQYFEDFANGNFISIGYNEILLFDVNLAKNTKNPTEFLADKVRKFYEENGTPAHTANQILKFVYEIKKGDVVLIPSDSSMFLKFGEVLEDFTYLKSESKDSDKCPFEKRKKVRWIKTISKDQLNPNLYKLIYSHHTITKANIYDQYIDKTLNTFFTKNNKAHLVLDVSTPQGINAKELFRMGLNLFDLLDNFCEEEQLQVSSDDIETKVNLSSPGTVELISNSVYALGIIGFIIVCLNGGDYELNFRVAKVSMSSKGLIQVITNFLNEKSDRKIKEQLVKQMEKMQLQSPDDITKILAAISKKINEKEDTSQLKINTEKDESQKS